MYCQILFRETELSGFSGAMKRFSELRNQNLARIPLLSIEPHCETFNETMFRSRKVNTYTNDEEDSSEHSRGHSAQNCKKRTSHGSPNSHTHQEVTDSLFNNSCSFYKWFTDLLAILGLYNL